MSASAHRYLTGLKGISRSIPNQGILNNTLTLQEAKDSPAIEKIIATHDELFREELFPEFTANALAKEVRRYASASNINFMYQVKRLYLTNWNNVYIFSFQKRT